MAVNTFSYQDFSAVLGAIEESLRTGADISPDFVLEDGETAIGIERVTLVGDDRFIVTMTDGRQVRLIVEPA